MTGFSEQLHRRKLHGILMIAFSGLAGCGIWPPPPQRPPEPPVPSAWSVEVATAATAASDAPWWQALQDPQLDALETAALQTNVEVLRKALSWQNALIQARQVELQQQHRPSLSLTNNINRPLSSGALSTVVVNGVNVPVGNTASTSRSYSSNLGLTYELDVWSKLSSSSLAARVDATSRQEALQVARWLVSTKVAETYWNIAAIDAKLPILIQLSRVADAAAQIAQLRLTEGVLRADEADAVVNKQHEAHLNVANARADRELQLNALAMLLDKQPTALVVSESRLPVGEPWQLALGSPAQTLERRPDVNQARLAVDAALARLQVAEASRYPSLSMSLNLGTSGTDWRDWFSQPLSSLGLNLMVPLVDWRRLDAERDKAHNDLEDAALALRASVCQALVDVHNALLEQARSRQERRVAQLRSSQKEAAFAVIQLREKEGVAGNADLLQGQQDMLTAQINIIDGRLKGWKNLLDLHKALGGAI
jgi:outer membrane protein TolC